MSNFGNLEWWSRGVVENNPVLQHSNTPLLRLISGNIVVFARYTN
jgi:hypothetical protein